MRKLTNKAFTLIELLVVITIIGILATWAVVIYQSQIQKWRDATRISALENLRSAIEQYYQDASEYPAANVNFSTGTSIWVKKYLDRLPTDPKSGQKTNLTFLDYGYVVWPDLNTLQAQRYEISTWFENDWNITAKAADGKDYWNNSGRLELWVNVDQMFSWSGNVAFVGASKTACAMSTTWSWYTAQNCIVIK